MALTLIGLALFGFCFFQLAFVTRVVKESGGTRLDEVSEAAAQEEAEVIDTRPVILVDAGHGGGDGGAVSGGVIEKHQALKIAKRLAADG